MPDLRYKTCKSCGRPSSEVGPLSWTRLCAACAVDNFVANLEQLVAHEGPYFLHWRRRIAASVGAGLLDEQRSNP